MTVRPPPDVRSAASALTAAGPTLVAGHSAHVFHGVAGRVLYDLGNFVDDYAVNTVHRNDLGLLFLVAVSEQGPEHVTAVPLRLHYARTEIAAGADRDLIAAKFTRACADLGTTITESNATLDISLRPRQ